MASVPTNHVVATCLPIVRLGPKIIDEGRATVVTVGETEVTRNVSHNSLVVDGVVEVAMFGFRIEVDPHRVAKRAGGISIIEVVTIDDFGVFGRGLKHIAMSNDRKRLVGDAITCVVLLRTDKSSARRTCHMIGKAGQFKRVDTKDAIATLVDVIRVVNVEAEGVVP